MTDGQKTTEPTPTANNETESPKVLVETEKYMAGHFDDLLAARFTIIDIKPMTLAEINAYQTILKAFPSMPVFELAVAKLSEIKIELVEHERKTLEADEANVETDEFSYEQ